MIETLKKQWFVVLIAIIFIAFAVYSTYDSNKGKLPGKKVDGKDAVATITDKTITADDLYKGFGTSNESGALFTKFQAAVVDKSIETNDEVKKYAETCVGSLQQQAQSDPSVGSNLQAYGFEPSDYSGYCKLAGKSAVMQDTYVSANIDTLFGPIYEKKNSRVVSHILVKMVDAKNPTEEEKKKVKEVEDALASGTDFKEVAKKYSDDGSATNGGLLGYMDTDTQYVESFKKQALGMKKGEVSGWVKESNESYNGWHIIKVDETDKKAIQESKEDAVKAGVITAITTANPELAGQYLWEAAKKLDIKYANDDIKKQLMDTLGVKE